MNVVYILSSMTDTTENPYPGSIEGSIIHFVTDNWNAVVDAYWTLIPDIKDKNKFITTPFHPHRPNYIAKHVEKWFDTSIDFGPRKGMTITKLAHNTLVVPPLYNERGESVL